jgi:transcriptional regulator with XRE-family HTH domain
MAGKLGVDPATLMGWETGRHQPTERSIEVIAKFLLDQERDQRSATADFRASSKSA